jgi:hypothetical protein
LDLEAATALARACSSSVRLPLAVLIAALAALATAAAPASAGWHGVEELGAAGAEPAPPAVASNSRGDVVAAWLSAGGVDVAVARRGRAFGPARTVPESSSATDVRVAVNERGKAVVVWLRGTPVSGSRVHVAGLNVDRGFGRSRAVTYSSTMTLGPAAIGPGGEVAVSFHLSGATYTRASDPRGHFHHIVGPPTHDAVGLAVSYEGARPRLVYGRAGEGLATLYVHPISRSPSARSRVVASGLPPDPRIHVASASNGTQAAVWAPTQGDAPVSVVAAVRRPGKRFVARAVARRPPPSDPRAAVARSGAALVGWGEPEGVATAFRAPGRAFRDAVSHQPVPKDTGFGSLRLAVDPEGRAALAWRAAREGGTSTRIAVAQQVRGGAIQAVRALTTYGEAAEPGDLAIDASERPAFGWRNGQQIFGIRGRVRG